jgi:hypothetical protein
MSGETGSLVGEGSTHSCLASLARDALYESKLEVAFQAKLGYIARCRSGKKV